MVVLPDNPAPSGPLSPSPPRPPPSSSSPSTRTRFPPLAIPQGSGALSRSATTIQSPPNHPSFLQRSVTTRHIPRDSVTRKELVSKINLLDLATEVTAVIFRYAHKPKDFHFLLPSGAGPLISRKYNLPLTVSKEWYRRVRPIYYETLLLTWLKVPDFVENVQRYDVLTRYINSVHVKIVGKAFYKVIKADGRKAVDDNSQPKLSAAQLYLLIGQYIDNPLAAFALCVDSLICLKDLTLRFTECRGGEVSLQTIAAIIANLPPSVQNLYLDCALVTKQSAKAWGESQISVPFMSILDLFHPDLIPDWEPPEDPLSAISLSCPTPSWPQLESFTIYREGRIDPTPRPCSEMYLFGHRKPVTRDDWPRQFMDYAVQAVKRGSFPLIKRFEIPSNAYHPNGKPCSSVFDVLQDDNYWNSNEAIIIDEEVDEDEEWSLPERWWKSRRRGMEGKVMQEEFGG